jgi:hypothetical protein
LQNGKQLKLFCYPLTLTPTPTLLVTLTLTQNHVLWHKKAKQKQKVKAANQKAAGKKNTKANKAEKEK